MEKEKENVKKSVETKPAQSVVGEENVDAKKDASAMPNDAPTSLSSVEDKKKAKEESLQKKAEEQERKRALIAETKAKKAEEKAKKQEEKKALKAEKRSQKEEKKYSKMQSKLDTVKEENQEILEAEREKAEHEKLVKEFSSSERSEVYKFTVERAEKTEKKPWWKYMVNVLVILAIVAVLVVGGYVGYLQASYSRIIDNQALEVENNIAKFVETGETYSITTYNIGFGAYSPKYTFFMDEGGYQNGKTTKGENSKAFSKDAVEKNTSGAISVASALDSDFYFFQEVDTDSTRSYGVNQFDMLKDSFDNYGAIFAKNLHTAYLCYPLFNPIGRMNSGIATLTKYYAFYTNRRSLPIEDGFINKFFDLDRCISITKIKLESSASRFLVLINVHLSAYDDGSIRAEQLKLLYDIMDFEYNKNNNYVVVGGDFNHALYGDTGVFANDMVIPGWLKQFPEGYGEEKLESMGYKIALDQSAVLNKVGTCRDSSVAYSKGSTLEVIIDGFIVSENVKIEDVKIVNTGFEYSDHNPVTMQFTLL